MHGAGRTHASAHPLHQSALRSSHRNLRATSTLLSEPSRTKTKLRRPVPSHVSLPWLPPHERSPRSTRHRTAQLPGPYATPVLSLTLSLRVQTRTRDRTVDARGLARSTCTCTSTCTPHAPTSPRTPPTRYALTLTPTPAYPRQQCIVQPIPDLTLGARTPHTPERPPPHSHTLTPTPSHSRAHP